MLLSISAHRTLLLVANRRVGRTPGVVGLKSKNIATSPSSSSLSYSLVAKSARLVVLKRAQQTETIRSRRLLSSTASASATATRSAVAEKKRLLSSTRVRIPNPTLNSISNNPKKTTLKKTSNKSSRSSSWSSSSSSNTNFSAEVEEPWLEAMAQWLRRQRTIPIPRWVTPGHQTVSYSEVFGHSSFVLVAISYAVDDFLLLRCIAVVGSSAMLVFTYFHPHGRVLWLPFKWNALFIAINSYRIGKVLLDRYLAQNLGAEFIALREDHFHLMDPVDFAKLVRLGKTESYSQGEVIISQGRDNRYVRLVLEGVLEVQRNGKMTYLLNEANFVSEAGLHAGLMLPGYINSCCTVVAKTNARLLAWDRDELLDVMERDRSIKQSLQNAMSWDIVRKLKTQRLLISGKLIDNPEEWTKLREEQTQHRYTAILRNLLQHPRLLNSAKGRVHLHNYRAIHHMDDEHHIEALKACGWTLQEFEQGYKNGAASHKRDEYYVGSGDDNGNEQKSWSWYLKDLYLRIFG